MIAIDDVQWLDTASAGVMGYAVRRLEDRARRAARGLADRARERPFRSTSTARRSPSAWSALPLLPLSFGAVQHLIQERLEFLPPRPALRRLHELSGGNPFFALELARALKAGTIQLEPGEPLPLALDELVGARLQALSAEARRALAAAAALAQPTVGLVEDGGG